MALTVFSMICSHSTPSEHHDDSNPQNSTSDLSQPSKQSLSPLDRVSNLSTCHQTLISLASCCHSFDRPVLQSIAESFFSISDISDDDWTDITQLPFATPVEDREDTFRLSDDVRTELHQSLWEEDAERWHTIHGVLADYFQGRSHTIVPADASPFDDVAWRKDCRSLTLLYRKISPMFAFVENWRIKSV